MRTGMRFMDKLWWIRTAAEPEGCAELASMVLRLLVPQGWRHGGLIQCQAGAAAMAPGAAASRPGYRAAYASCSKSRRIGLKTAPSREVHWGSWKCLPCHPALQRVIALQQGGSECTYCCGRGPFKRCSMLVPKAGDACAVRLQHGMARCTACATSGMVILCSLP